MNKREHRNAIDRACRRIEASQTPPDLATLAAEAGLSPWHFQRVFKAAVGLSPKRYAMARREQDFGRRLAGARSVTDAIYDSGYAASSAAYRDSRQLGMQPASLRDGGANESIRYATAKSSLGPILVAATDRGICMVEFGAGKALVEQLRVRFPNAVLSPADGALDEWVRRVVEQIDSPLRDAGLPLDIQGTAFQRRVWHALTRIPSGETVSYGELARRLKAPTSTRAVARACATNGIAVLVPCHRVVAADGSLTGYKWGITRKRSLLAREKSDVEPKPARAVRAGR
jgi:AraC family transcriptional regulator, regulatory protein of adaptative response / methylated-DNA-[protein]-cysteine methyltransferase